MKQGTYNHLKVVFDGVDLDQISRVEFVFTQTLDGEVVKSAIYTSPNNPVPGDVLLEDGVFLVPFTREDTYLFKQGATFFMDTRIVPFGSVATSDNPPTPIVTLRMDPTLFYYADNPGGVRND